MPGLKQKTTARHHDQPALNRRAFSWPGTHNNQQLTEWKFNHRDPPAPVTRPQRAFSFSKNNQQHQLNQTMNIHTIDPDAPIPYEIVEPTKPVAGMLLHRGADLVDRPTLFSVRTPTRKRRLLPAQLMERRKTT